MTEKIGTKPDSNIRSQMRKGILEYCVLLLLSRGRAYPSDIINCLSEADLIVVEGTLYTLLNRLRKEGKLSYEWEESPKGPPRKYYFITSIGKDTLSEMSDAWDEIVANVNHFRNLTSQTDFTNPQEPATLHKLSSEAETIPDQNQTFKLNKQ